MFDDDNGQWSPPPRLQRLQLMPLRNKVHLRRSYGVTKSGSRESNPVCTNPNRTYYRHTPPRNAQNCCTIFTLLARKFETKLHAATTVIILIHNPSFVHTQYNRKSRHKSRLPKPREESKIPFWNPVSATART